MKSKKNYLPTQIAVELSSGSNGHLAIPLPIPGNGSFDTVKLDCIIYGAMMKNFKRIDFVKIGEILRFQQRKNEKNKK